MLTCVNVKGWHFAGAWLAPGPLAHLLSASTVLTGDPVASTHVLRLGLSKSL